jgi:pimeloyl-ACP methyl ester carboxylesterase
MNTSHNLNTAKRNVYSAKNNSIKPTMSKQHTLITISDRLLPTKTIRLKIEGINIRFTELGESSNPTLILLHGVPENLHCWYAVAPILAKNYHVLALDWPGFGGSDALASTELYNSQHFAEILVDFMDTLAISKANLIATDISLLPALLVGLEHPERVLKLAVMDGIPFPRPQYASWELRSFAKKGSILGKALVCWFPDISSKIARMKGFYRGNSIPKEIRQEFASDGKNKANQIAFLSYFQNFHIGQAYFEQNAKNLKSEVLVIWGNQDRFISKKLGVEIAETIPNANLKIIDKAGHYVHMDKPNELTAIVSKFIG